MRISPFSDYADGPEQYRQKVEILQAQFKNLNTLGETDIIAAYQTAKALQGAIGAGEPHRWREEKYLKSVMDAAQARMRALILSAGNKAERRRLTEVFRGVVHWQFASDLWYTWDEEEQRALREAQEKEQRERNAARKRERQQRIRTFWSMLWNRITSREPAKGKE